MPSTRSSQPHFSKQSTSGRSSPSSYRSPHQVLWCIRSFRPLFLSVPPTTLQPLPLLLAAYDRPLQHGHIVSAQYGRAAGRGQGGDTGGDSEGGSGGTAWACISVGASMSMREGMCGHPPALLSSVLSYPPPPSALPSAPPQRFIRPAFIHPPSSLHPPAHLSSVLSSSAPPHRCPHPSPLFSSHPSSRPFSFDCFLHHVSCPALSCICLLSPSFPLSASVSLPPALSLSLFRSGVLSWLTGVLIGVAVARLHPLLHQSRHLRVAHEVLCYTRSFVSHTWYCVTYVVLCDTTKVICFIHKPTNQVAQPKDVAVVVQEMSGAAARVATK